MVKNVLHSWHIVNVSGPMDAKDTSGQASNMGDPTTLIDVLSIPTVCEVALRHLDSVTALRLTCHVICALVRLLHAQLKKLREDCLGPEVFYMLSIAG
jgi:hypothetical protein